MRIKSLLSLVYSHYVRFFLCFLPDSPRTMRFRGLLYSFAMKNCGRDFQVSSTAVLRGLERIECGDNVYIGPNSYVMAREAICIGSEVLIAMNVVIVDGNHGKNEQTNSYRYKRGSVGKITIGKGAWLAANSVVTAGAIIDEGALVKPCTVVRRGDSI